MYNEINNTQVDDAQNIDVVTPMYNIREYSDASLRTSGSLSQYYRDEPALGKSGNIIYFPDDNNNSASFKFKQKITRQTVNGDTKDVEIMVPLKYLSSFWRTLEMPLLNCEISLQLQWTRKWIIASETAYNQNPIFPVNDAKFYVPVIILSTQETKEYSFKRTINWNKYLAKIINQAQSRYLDYLIDPSFQEVNRIFVLSFKDADGRESHKQYYLPTAGRKRLYCYDRWKNLFW